MSLFVAAIGLALAAILLFCYIVMLTHEIGHAIGAMVSGLFVERVAIGSMGNPWRFHIYGTEVLFSLGLSTGSWNSGYKREKIKWQRYVMILCGPLANIFFASIILLIFLQYRIGMAHKYEYYAWLFIIFANVITGIEALIPRYINIPAMGGINESDGLRLWRIHSYTEAEMQDILASAHIYAATRKIESSDYAQAIMICEKAASDYPMSNFLANCLSVAHMYLGNLSNAAKALEPFVDKQMNPLFAYLIHFNLAMGLLLEGSEQGILKAINYSRVTKKTFFNERKVGEALLAAIDVESGNYDQGVTVLEKYVQKEKPPDRRRNTIFIIMYLAYGYYLQGKYPEARKLASMAQSSELAEEPLNHALIERIRRTTVDFKTPAN
ncbi:MAG: site-2 protease family protein [Nitrospinota bacterium]|nr:site-2 protease family protein [Nitrospinota bacterium]